MNDADVPNNGESPSTSKNTLNERGVWRVIEMYRAWKEVVECREMT